MYGIFTYIWSSHHCPLARATYGKRVNFRDQVSLCDEGPLTGCCFGFIQSELRFVFGCTLLLVLFLWSVWLIWREVIPVVMMLRMRWLLPSGSARSSSRRSPWWWPGGVSMRCGAMTTMSFFSTVLDNPVFSNWSRRKLLDFWRTLVSVFKQNWTVPTISRESGAH